MAPDEENRSTIVRAKIAQAASRGKPDTQPLDSPSLEGRRRKTLTFTEEPPSKRAKFTVKRGFPAGHFVMRPFVFIDIVGSSFIFNIFSLRPVPLEILTPLFSSQTFRPGIVNCDEPTLFS
jgi:hypothetical protein